MALDRITSSGLDLMLSTSQVSKAHRLELIDFAQVRPNAALLESSKCCLADLGLGDQLGTSLIKGSKDVCGSLELLTICSDSVEGWNYLSVGGESIGIGVINSITSLMVARILLDSRTLSIMSVPFLSTDEPWFSLLCVRIQKACSGSAKRKHSHFHW